MSTRLKLACTECTRRKIKCDRVIPCANCIKRGHHRACRREEEQNTSPSPRVVGEYSSDNLTERVATLESTLERLTSAVETLVQQGNHIEVTNYTQSRNDSNIDHQADSLSNLDQVENAATIIEFLAWGRQKTSNGHDEPVMPMEDPSQQELARFGYLGLLLPAEDIVRTIVHYHSTSILWYDGSYLSSTLQKRLNKFYGSTHDISWRMALQPTWVALLFAVLTSSLACASAETARTWGYDLTSASETAQKLYNAALTCLELGDYMAKPDLLSVQCVATLTLPAHLLGYSTKQSILLATAIRIAQTLNMHQLGVESAVDGQGLVERETRRRVWCQLATQDFFQTPFSETNTINLALTTTDKPRNAHDHDLELLPQEIPTLTSFIRFKYDIAVLLAQLQLAMAASKTPHAQYEHVLRIDKELRVLATSGRPPFLAPGPLREGWPHWIPWARRAVRISCAHKVIMIHRKFLSLSFTNEAFALTRKICIAASNTILSCQSDEVDPVAPILWIEHAFVVTACVILAFDLLYSPRGDRAWQQTHDSIKAAIENLSKALHSKIAIRGVRLLRALLQRVTSPIEQTTSLGKRKRGIGGTLSPSHSFDTRAFVNEFLRHDAPTQDSRPIHTQTFDDMLDLFATETPDGRPLGDSLDNAWQIFDTGAGWENLHASPMHDIFCGL